MNKDLIIVIPGEITFPDAQPEQIAKNQFFIKNISNQKLDLQLSAVSEQRYQFTPAVLAIAPQQQQLVQISALIPQFQSRLDFKDGFMIQAADKTYEKRVQINFLPMQSTGLRQYQQQQPNKQQLQQLQGILDNSAPASKNQLQSFIQEEEEDQDEFMSRQSQDQGALSSSKDQISSYKSPYQPVDFAHQQGGDAGEGGLGQDQGQDQSQGQGQAQDYDRELEEQELGTGDDQPYQRVPVDYQQSQLQQQKQQGQVVAQSSQYYQQQQQPIQQIEQIEEGELIQVYKRIIEEKDNLIEKLEGEVMIEREKYENSRIEIGEKQLIESNYQRLKVLLRDQNPDVQQVVELALQNERMENERKSQKIIQIFQEKDLIIKQQEVALREKEIQIQELEETAKQQITQISKLDQANMEKQNLFAELDSLEVELKACKVELQKREEEFNSAVQQLQMQQRGFLHKAEAHEQSLVLIDQLNKQIRDLQNENQRLVQLQTQAQQESQQIIASKDQLISKLQSELLDFSAAEKKALPVKLGVEQELLQQQQQTATLQRQLKEQQAQNTDLQQQILTLQQESESGRATLQSAHSEQIVRTSELEDLLRKEKSNYIQLHRKYEDLASKFTETQQDKIKLNEEVEILSRRLEEQQEMDYQQQQQSSQSSSSQGGIGGQQIFGGNNADAEQKISRLNAKISQLKVQNQKMLDENARIEGLYNELQEEFTNYRDACEKERAELFKFQQEQQQQFQQIYLAQSSQQQQQAVIFNRQQQQQGSMNNQPDANLAQMSYAQQQHVQQLKSSLLSSNSCTGLMGSPDDLGSSQNSYQQQQQQQQQLKLQQLAYSPPIQQPQSMGYQPTQQTQQAELCGRKVSGSFGNEADILRATNQDFESRLLHSLNNEKLLKRRLEILESENEQLTKTTKNMQKIVEEQEQKQLESEGNLRAENNELEARNIQLQRRGAALEREVQSLRGDAEASQSQREVSSQITQKFEKDIVKMKMTFAEESNALREQLSSHQRSAEEYRQQVEDLLQQLRGIQKASEDKELKLQSLRKELDLIKASREQLLAENTAINEINRKNGVELETFASQMMAFKDKTENELKRRDDLENKLQERVQILEAELGQLDQDRRSWQQQSFQQDKFEEITTSLQREKQMLEMQLQQMQAERERDLNEHAEKEALLSRQLAELKSDLDRIQYGGGVSAAGSQGKRYSQQQLQQQQQLQSTTHSGLLTNSEQKRKNHSRSTKRSNSRGGNGGDLLTDSDGEQQNNRQTKKLQQQPSSVCGSCLNCRSLEMELQTKNLQIMQDQQKLEHVKAKLKKLEESLCLLEAELTANKRALKEREGYLEQLERERDILQIQTKHVEAVDAKMIEELNSLRDCMKRIAAEKERICLQLSEEVRVHNQAATEKQQAQAQTSELLQLIKTLEEKFKKSEQSAIATAQDLQKQLLVAREEIETTTRRVRQLTEETQAKEEEIVQLMEENKGLNDLVLQEREKYARVANTSQEAERQKYVEVHAHQQRIDELKQEKDKSELAIAMMKEEMLEQNRKFQETIEIYESQLRVAREKFLGDIDDIQQKIIVFHQQSQQQSGGTQQLLIKPSDRANILKIFESYAENTLSSQQKEAQIKQTQDKLKMANAELLSQKGLIQKLSDSLKSAMQEGAALKNANSNYITKTQQGSANKKQMKAGATNSSTAMYTNQSQTRNKTTSSKQKMFSRKEENKENSSISINNITGQQYHQTMTLESEAVSPNSKLYGCQQLQLPSQTAATSSYNQASISDMARLEAQLLTAQAQIKMLTQEVNHLKELNNNLQSELENQQQSDKSAQEENRRLSQQIQTLQNKLKDEAERSKREGENLTKTSDTLEQLQTTLKEREQQLKEVRDDLNRKKDLINNMKHGKDEKEYELSQAKTELEQLREEIEKQKKANKELIRKETSVKELKEKLEAARSAEKTLSEEKSNLTEKLKTLKAEVQRKDAQIKELKDKLDSVLQMPQGSLEGGSSLCGGGNSGMGAGEDDLQKLKETIKKLKADLERKEQNLKMYKTKLDQALSEIDTLKTEQINKTTTSINDLERETRKHEQSRMALKKVENQYSMLVFLVKRIFRDMFVTCQKLRNKSIQQQSFQQQQQRSSTDHGQLNQSVKTVGGIGNRPGKQVNHQKFTESMNILNLAPEDIDQFLDPEKYEQQNHSRNSSSNQMGGLGGNDSSGMTMMGEVIDKFEKELENSENLNINNLYNMICSMVEERINLEKKL